MKPIDLTRTARGLTELSPRRPTQANLRRAVSTAYYAIFHCLASSAANLLIGKMGKRSLERHQAAWYQVYRALEHGMAKNACQQKQVLEEFPLEIRRFARSFVDLQQARQRADYALDGDYYKSDVVAEIDAAERAIRQFERTDVKDRRSFAAHVLFKRRP